LEKNQGIALNKKKAKNRLLSYWHSKDKPKDFKRYLRKGE
jgi:hypothetical protein